MKLQLNNNTLTMRLLVLTVILFWSVVGISQVPLPPTVNKPTTNKKIEGKLKWQMVSAGVFEFTNENGSVVPTRSRRMLSRLSTDTVPFIDKSSRNVYILPDAYKKPAGTQGNVIVFENNVPNDFVLANKYRIAAYLDTKYQSGPLTRIVNNDYILYLEDTNSSYQLINAARPDTKWFLGAIKKLPPSFNNSYWYKTAAEKYVLLVKGKVIDYNTVTTQGFGNDLVLNVNNTPTYILKNYGTQTLNTITSVMEYDASKIDTTPQENTIGCVSGDCINGWGKYTYENGFYDGFWTDGKKNGYGAYSWNNSAKYTGNWVNDTMAGFGVYYQDDNNIKYGEWDKGNLNGYGYALNNGNWEYGIYKDGILVTPYDFSDNNVDTGCVSGDCQNKFGSMVWSNGDMFVGFFKDGNLYMGEYHFANKDYYKGYFNTNNEFHYEGVFGFSDQSLYNGKWKNGKYHGKGYYHDKDKKQQIGIWKDGVLITPMK